MCLCALVLRPSVTLYGVETPANPRHAHRDIFCILPSKHFCSYSSLWSNTHTHRACVTVLTGSSLHSPHSSITSKVLLFTVVPDASLSFAWIRSSFLTSGLFILPSSPSSCSCRWKKQKCYRSAAVDDQSISLIRSFTHTSDMFRILQLVLKSKLVLQPPSFGWSPPLNLMFPSFL